MDKPSFFSKIKHFSGKKKYLGISILLPIMTLSMVSLPPLANQDITAHKVENQPKAATGASFHVKMEAEKMAETSGSQSIVLKENWPARALDDNGTASTNFDAPISFSTIELRAAGSYTGETVPRVQVKIDGQAVGEISLTNKNISNYKLTGSWNVGNHEVQVTHLNDVGSNSALIDNIIIGGSNNPVAAPTPAPTVPAPTPTPVPTTPPTTPTQPAGYLPGWGAPTFSDEFNGDLSQWRVRNGESLSYDKARILSRNVTTSNGFLNITAKRETVDGRDFTTGYIDTIGKYTQQYGRWEIRAKIPTIKGQSRGVWPAFWLRNGTVGEIDIMEAWGDPFTGFTYTGTSSMTAHESTNGGGQRKGFNWERLAGTTVHSAEGFHTWAIEYTPTELRGYFDGKHVITMKKAEYPWLWGPNFQSPLNMRLNLQIGSPYHGYPVGPDYTDTKMPANFQVDYVRAWKMP